MIACFVLHFEGKGATILTTACLFVCLFGIEKGVTDPPPRRSGSCRRCPKNSRPRCGFYVKKRYVWMWCGKVPSAQHRSIHPSIILSTHHHPPKPIQSDQSQTALLLAGGKDGGVGLEVEARNQRVHPRPQRLAGLGGPVACVRGLSRCGRVVWGGLGWGCGVIRVAPKKLSKAPATTESPRTYKGVC